tara:strand:+ start:432 stop:1157 length:726 start_codon:yes stop_codon:yes gene_type:complete
MNIALLIPSTSNKRDWKTTEDGYLTKILLPSFASTYNPEYKYTFFIGIDEDDKYYTRDRAKEIQDIFHNIIKQPIQLHFVITGVEKGYVTEIWNVLFKLAYDKGNEYFVQLGDDITFLDRGWDISCINKLKNNNNIGVCGLFDETRKNCEKFLLTQTMVHKKHMDIFGFYFPSEIRNWYCDDWITNIYKETNNMFVTDERIGNIGGEPRYEVNDCPCRCKYLINKYKENINQFINKNKYMD